MLNLLWIISYDVKLPAPSTFLSLYITIYVAFLVILNLISSLVTQFLILAAQCFNGTGSFAQTRCAILYSLIALLPVNILSCVLQFTFQQPNPNEWITLKLIAYLGIIFSLFCAFGLLIRSIALSHRINKFYAFISVLIGVGVVVLTSQVLFWLKDHKD